MKNSVKSGLVLGGSLLVGAVSGFFGGGGGMLCVPLLEASGLSCKKAHATALIVIFPICIVSAAIYIANGYFDFTAVLCAVIGVTLGAVAGAFALDKLSGWAVGLIFAALMMAIGLKLVIA